MARLTSISGSFSAHLVAARLQSEGIDVQLRGALDGPYGFNIGEMARVDVFVPADQLDDAELVMLATEVDAALAAPREWAGPDATRSRRWIAWVALALLVVAGLTPLLRMLAG
jgi:Putative prokaryotic signal transducing protein